MHDLSEHDLFDVLSTLPATFYATVFLLSVLTIESLRRLRELRGVMMAAVYGTIFLWYMIDPLTDFKPYSKFAPSELEQAYAQVFIFLLGFRACIEFAPRTPTLILRKLEEFDLDHGPLVKLVMLCWATLFAIGLWRVNFNVLNALYPIDARRDWSSYMWNRPQVGDSTAFLVSAAGYFYNVVCAFFGVMAVVTRRPQRRVLMISMALLTWPMFVFTGSRHMVITVVAPTMFVILMTKRWPAWKMATFVIATGAMINLAMLAAIEFRKTGFGEAFEKGEVIKRLERARHQGMNMTEELMYVNRYQRLGKLEVEYGMNYVANALNIIPRPIWPGKPFVGREFSRLRVGLIRGQLPATMSFGIVGQGVANFGPWLGPLAPALILLFYCTWAIRILNHGHLFLRCCVFLIALAKVPNLGRDITMFDLWVVAFAYVATLLYERFFEPRVKRLARLGKHPEPQYRITGLQPERLPH